MLPSLIHNRLILFPPLITSHGNRPSEAVWRCCPEVEKNQIHQLLYCVTGLLTELSYLQYDTSSLQGSLQGLPAHTADLTQQSGLELLQLPTPTSPPIQVGSILRSPPLRWEKKNLDSFVCLENI